MPEQEESPKKSDVFLSYKDRVRPISDNTYAVYCSYLRKARYNFAQTQHPAHAAEVKKWERNILRVGRELPPEKPTVDEALDPPPTPVSADLSQAEQKIDLALGLMLKAHFPTLDVNNPEQVKECLFAFTNKKPWPPAVEEQPQPLAEQTGE